MDKEVLEAVRGEVAKVIWRAENGAVPWDKTDKEPIYASMWEARRTANLKQAYKILSLRGNIVDGKFIPSESGRYAVRVVDLETKEVLG